MLDRLLKRTEKTDTCWIWRGQLTWNGYGKFVYWKDKRNHCSGAHRLMYEALVGPIPKGLTLDHLCGNPRCVNPDHLEAVTLKENIRRSPRAISPICKYGHLYRQQSPFYIKKGARRCHECHAEAARIKRGGVSLLSKI